MAARQRSACRLPRGLVVFCLTLHALAPIGADAWEELDGFAPFLPFNVSWPSVKKFDRVDFSHNWCKIKEKILRGQLSFKDALRGQNVSVLLAMQNNPVSVIYDKATRTITGGVPAEVLLEVARRAGFSFKRSIAVVDFIDRSKNESDEDWLDWATGSFDVVDWFTITPERRQRGLYFAYPFFDNSPLLVGRLEIEEPNVWDRFLFCLAPFSFRLWGMIVVGLLLSAAVYVSIEAGGRDIPQKTPVGGTSQAFFLTVCQFTGGGGFAPRTPAGKLFVMSVSFLVMLLVTAFTANLASDMIIDKVPHAPIRSPEDAAAMSLPICVRRGSPISRMMSRRYPDVQLFLVNDEEEKFRAVMRGDCVAAITGQGWWEYESKMQRYNAECQLYTLGRNLMDMKGSFVAQAESSACKDLVIDVMIFTMHEMYLDGFYQEIKGVYTEEFADISCPARGAIESQKMEPRHMLGTFLVHAIVSFVCIGISMYFGNFGLPGCGSKCQGTDDEDEDSPDSGSCG